MQPLLVIRCDRAGIVYLNGVFCGEANGAQGFPLRGDACAYVEYSALDGQALPVAIALTFDQGRLTTPLPPTAYAVVWPDNVIELEIRPISLPIAPDSAQTKQSIPCGDGELTHRCAHGEDTLCWRGEPLCELPQGMRDIQSQAFAQGMLVWGKHADGACAVCIALHGDAPVARGQLRAQSLSVESGDTLIAIEARDDIVGHADSVSYRFNADGFSQVGRRPGWAQGAPRWPRTADDTLCAYLQALRMGLADEATRYLTPEAAAMLTAAPLPVFDAVVSLPHPLLAAPPDCPLAQGILHVRQPNLGVVRAVCAHAVPSQHAQGSWLLDRVQWEASRS